MSQLNPKTLQQFIDFFDSIENRLADPIIASDPEKLTELSQERSRIEQLVYNIREYQSKSNQLKELSQAISKETDPELRTIIKQELNDLESFLPSLEESIKIDLLPKDPLSGKNIFVEIRAGTGGDEAALFARDLFRMYIRYLENQKVITNVISLSETGINGVKEVIFLAKGPSAYDILHHEAGTHRVQRIPETESSGRIHTSTVTVAIIPEADEAEVEVDGKDLRIDVFRASGAGGQHVNRTESAVRITHIPTNLVVSCQDEKSQHKNKAKAMKVLISRLAEIQRQKQNDKIAIEKKSQIGSGDRSEKIRTYNFPQSRITDHRINFTSHNLDKIMQGELDEIISALLQEERARKLEHA